MAINMGLADQHAFVSILAGFKFGWMSAPRTASRMREAAVDRILSNNHKLQESGNKFGLTVPTSFLKNAPKVSAACLFRDTKLVSYRDAHQ
jgi:hypothetical protein